MDTPRPSSPARRAADAVTSLRRRLLRRRRLIAVVLLGVAVAATIATLAPPPPATTSLVVAARDLPAGHVLAADDLVEKQVPPGVVPSGAAQRVDDQPGRALAAPLRAGEAVTDVRLVGQGLAAVHEGDELALPVRLSDAGQAALLTVGDRIDLLATDPKAGSTLPLARSATVLAVPDADRASDGALPGRLVVLGMSSADVQEVTSASVTAYVTYTWSRR